jgi:hypothetical protein
MNQQTNAPPQQYNAPPQQTNNALNRPTPRLNRLTPRLNNNIKKTVFSSMKGMINRSSQPSRPLNINQPQNCDNKDNTITT